MTYDDAVDLKAGYMGEVHKGLSLYVVPAHDDDFNRYLEAFVPKYTPDSIAQVFTFKNEYTIALIGEIRGLLCHERIKPDGTFTLRTTS